ncbi:hypothetical protein EON81_18625 [bacterium]|nr:MAG: hypothetical protein EON81_18625 [bacterium]
MSVLDVRPVPTCKPASCSCGTDGLNYGGGDCLPGRPGPIPSATCGCGQYTSGAPYEGTTVCPECDDYNIADWEVDVTLTGKAVCTTPGGGFSQDIHNGQNFILCGSVDGTYETLKGKGLIDITYTGDEPYPSKVKVRVSSQVIAQSPGGNASNGLGHPYKDYKSDGFTDMELPVSESGKAIFKFSLFGSIQWGAGFEEPIFVLGLINASVLECD